jgi:hypothetical protein
MINVNERPQLPVEVEAQHIRAMRQMLIEQAEAIAKLADELLRIVTADQKTSI